MSTPNKSSLLAWLCAALALPLAAQDTNLKINLPPDSPVTVGSSDWGESRTSARGGALVVDLHTALSLRNSGPRRIRGITLLVLAQDVTPGGKASVSVPSLDVGPGENFPVRIDLSLLKPVQASGGPLVQVSLDGVLFEDLTFYGPNRLNSRRSMIAWEMEARRDRQYFKSLLAAKGAEGLRQEVLSSMARQAQRPRLDVQFARGRATNYEPEREVQFAFLRLPDSPVDPADGVARIAGNEARAPRLEVRNRSDRAIRYLEVGWMLKDRQGREYLAGSVPAEVNLAPGQKSVVLQDASLKFSQRPGQPVVIDSMAGFVNHVEFADGGVWVPSRAALSDPRLQHVLPPSPEEQRLVELYRKKGINALVDELKKF